MSAEGYRFGEFDFEVATRVLRHQGQVVKMQAQPAQLLLVLLARGGQVVTRDELKQAIWGDNTYVDFEKGLNFCMGQVRSALRDDASRPLYIRTLPKQGYQFIAPIETVSATPAEPGNAIGHGNNRPQWASFTGAGIGVIVLLLGAVVYLLVAHARNDPRLAVLRFDAEGGSPATQTLASHLTDEVVVRLAQSSGGHYRVIGNAKVLRLPRDQRDLGAIASSLGCKYAVLGQVQAEGDKVLVLAHLIRLSDLTHIEVVRMEANARDPMALEAQVSAEVASRFSAKMADHPESAASFRSAKH